MNSSRCLSRLRAAALLLASGLMAMSVTACSDNGITLPNSTPTPTPVGNPGPATLQVLQFAPDSLVLPENGVGTLKLTGKMSDGSTMQVADASWGATVGGIIAMNAATGAITAVGRGKTYVLVTKGTLQAQAVVEVRAANPASLAHAHIRPDVLCLRVGSDYQYVMHTYDAAGIEDTPGPSTWSVSDPSLASISADGKLHSLKGGHLTVTGTSKGMSDVAEVTLDPAVVPAPMTCK